GGLATPTYDAANRLSYVQSTGQGAGLSHDFVYSARLARCHSNWDSGAPVNHYLELLQHSNEQLAKVDPLLMNLLVAKSIPSLAGLDIARYQRQADEWAAAITKSLPRAERVFRKTPHYWKNDINFFRLGVLCEFLEKQAGIAYREDQRN